MKLELSDPEVSQLLTILGNTRDFPWSVTNPLLMKIGEQARIKQTTNSQEMPINAEELRIKQ